MWMCMVPKGFLHSVMAEMITNDSSFLAKAVNNTANMPCRLSVVSVNLQSADLLLVTGMYLSNPRVPVSPPHDMPALVLFHCFLNSISGSPGLWDCSVIIRRRLFLSGIQRAMAVIQWDVCRAIVLGPGEETAPTFKTVPKGEGRDEPLKMDGQHRRFF